MLDPPATRKSFELRVLSYGHGSPTRSPQSAWRLCVPACGAGGLQVVVRPGSSHSEEPGCPRHVRRSQHRRHTTISHEGHLSLLPLGKSRRARPDVAFRGRVGGGWGRGKRRLTASPRSNAARRRAKGAQRWRIAGPTSARARRARYPRTRGRGRRPRTAGGNVLSCELRSCGRSATLDA